MSMPRREASQVYLMVPAKNMVLNIFYLKIVSGILIYWEIKQKNKYSWKKILRQKNLCIVPYDTEGPHIFKKLNLLSLNH